MKFYLAVIGGTNSDVPVQLFSTDVFSPSRPGLRNEQVVSFMGL